ncbi:MAG: hypothetical protein GWO16_08400 [Gammaproteobacteria bacterium]|nr:hypothetical protein [Gammaproteobacteria bacterium]NIR97969.1 hypothetical protein [Gammaproteobacteria bacterium]NIT63669.1 hypothetical protein [Gammaproteobacteria bacterium]NIV21527.1 hypothetical protein [Gammaproteobacteria bacterium]NIY32249.1 hypothetical protein [Gammaproteobacteria bacterium]
MDAAAVVGALDLIAAGGDLATYGLLYFVWRLDRRLLELETRHEALHHHVKRVRHGTQAP